MPALPVPPAAIVMQVAPAPVAAPAPVTAAPLRVDEKGRPMIPVTVDGVGPIQFIVDTGAVSSVLRAQTVQTLRLKATGETLQVSGVAAAEAASIYRVRRLDSALFQLRDIAMPGLAAIGTTEAGGIVGMDLFATRKLVFDRAHQEVRITPSSPAPAGYTTIKGRYEQAGLYVPMTMNGIAVEALVDSGAEGTVIGPGVLVAMGWKNGDPRLAKFGQLGGAGGGGTDVTTTTIDDVRLGPVAFERVAVLVNNQIAPPRTPGGPPRVILGLNVLNRLRVYAVDTPLEELQILPLTVAAP